MLLYNDDDDSWYKVAKFIHFLCRRAKTVIWKKEKLVEPLTKMSYKEERMR